MLNYKVLEYFYQNLKEPMTAGSARNEMLREKTGWKLDNDNDLCKGKYTIRYDWYKRSSSDNRPSVNAYIVEITKTGELLAKFSSDIHYIGSQRYTEITIPSINAKLAEVANIINKDYEVIKKFMTKLEDKNSALARSNLVKHFDRLCTGNSYSSVELDEDTKVELMLMKERKQESGVYDLDICKYEDHYIFCVTQDTFVHHPEFVASNGIKFVEASYITSVQVENGNLVFNLGGSNDAIDIYTDIEISEIKKAFIEFEAYHYEVIEAKRLAEKLANKN